MTIDQSTLLDERYRLDERIGTGGMADVFRATDEVLNRKVAVKVLREVSDATQRNRFIEEARTLAGLDHPGLITLLDAGIRGERPYLVMTLVEGDTLSSRIASGPLQPDEVAALGSQVARALAYAHGQGVVPRDVKPSNVLLCGDGRALLADFGIARLVGATDHHTRTGEAIGSPAYLAPEQVTGEELTPALDIYSLGLVLLEALTATRAYPGSPVEAAIARLNAAPRVPDSLLPAWRDLIVQMTQRDPQARPSALEVADQLESAPLAGARGPLALAPEEEPVEDDAEHTSVLPTGAFDLAVPAAASTVYGVPLGDSHEVSPAPVRTRMPRPRLNPFAVVLVLVAVGVVVALAVLLNGGGEATSPDRTTVPSGVPSKYQAPLSDLHDAVNGAAR